MLIFTKNYEIFHSKAFIVMFMFVTFLILNTHKLNSNEENQQSNNFNSNPLTNVLELFVGNWICIDTINAKIIEKDKIDITYENWRMIDKFTLIGNSFKIRNTISKKNDTIFKEDLKIIYEKDKFVYSAKTSQNHDTIRFVCKNVKISLGSSNIKDMFYNFTFENKLHDFPNFLTYSFINDSTINVYVKDNEGKGFCLLYKRVKL